MLQEPTSKPPMEVSGAGSGTGAEHSRRSKANAGNQEHILKCPRCDSLNTKFCYYNNYSLTQPRHFCKNCRRYWTQGGSLRNVPIGGGCRKNKRVKLRTMDSHDLFASSLGMTDHHHHRAFLQSATGAAVPGSFIPNLGSTSCFTPITPPGLISDLVSPVDNQYQLLGMAFSRLQRDSLKISTPAHDDQQEVHSSVSLDATKRLSDLIQQPQAMATLYDADASYHNMSARPEHVQMLRGSDVNSAALFEHSATPNSGAHLVPSCFMGSSNTHAGSLTSNFGDQQTTLCNTLAVTAVTGPQGISFPCGTEAQMPNPHGLTLVQLHEQRQAAQRLALHLGACASEQHEHAMEMDPISYNAPDECATGSAPHQQFIDLHRRQNPQLALPDFEEQESPSAMSVCGKGRAQEADVQTFRAGAMGNMISRAPIALAHVERAHNADQICWQDDVRICQTHGASDEHQLQVSGFASELGDHQRPPVTTAGYPNSNSPVAYNSHEQAHISFWSPAASTAAGAWSSRHDAV